MTGDRCKSCGSNSTQKVGLLLHWCLRCRYSWEAEPPAPYIATDDVVLMRDDKKRRVEVARCIHCEKITINPWARCSCGNELHPVTVLVALGEAWDAKEFLGR